MHWEQWLFRFVLLFVLLLPFPGFAGEYAASGVRVVSDRWPDAGSPESFGRDAVRLAGAATHEEKAIAVWRFIRQMTVAGLAVPKEPAAGIGYVLSPEKLLNVYGVHWCDGLSRIMTITWRSLGYRADKLYHFGHTLADCWWEDADGIDRSHVFDLSQHWFVYDRPGEHIATAEQLALDYSLLYYPSRTPVPDKPSHIQPSWVHAGHLDLESHSMDLHLRSGERIEFLFGNEGKPYFNLFPSQVRHDFEHGPYPLTYGNGRLTTEPNLEAWSGEMLIPIELPYVISDVFLTFSGLVEQAGQRIVVSLSTDGGQRWRVLWESGDGAFDVRQLDVCPGFDPTSTRKVNGITPFGRYAYLLKVEKHGEGDFLDTLKIETVFQHNTFALPMLWPGENRIAVRGRIQQDLGLRVRYRWDDALGQGREHVQEIASLPATFRIETAGDQWEEVRCRSLSIEVGDGMGKSNGKVSSPTSAQPSRAIDLPYPTHRSIGSRNTRSPNYARDTKELEEALKKKDRSVIADRIVALGALHDPRSAELLEKVIIEDDSSRTWHKILACQSLYQSIGARCVPFMIRVLEKDETIRWAQPTQKWTRDAMWLHTAAMATAILADHSDFPERERVADLIADILQGKSTQTSIEKMPRGEEISWGLVRALGKLGDKRHVPLLLSYLEGNVDRKALAVEALGRIGEPVALPHIIPLLEAFEYPPVGLNAIRAIGRLGESRHCKLLYRFLDHWDEAFRGAAAQALSDLGGPHAADKLNVLIQKEKHSWVRKVAQESLEKLKAGT